MKLIISIFFLFFSVVSHSSSEDICSAMEKLKEDRKERRISMSTVLKLLFAPSKFIEIKKSYGPEFKGSSRSYSDQGRNLVISLGLNSKMWERVRKEKLLQKREEIISKIKGMSKEMNYLYSAKNIVECHNRLKTVTLNVDEVMEIGEEIDSLDFLRDIKAARYIEREFKILNTPILDPDPRIGHKILMLDWELIEASDISEIKEYLTSPDVENVVIISHTTPSGQMVDSQRRLLVRELFNNISKSIKSIGLFSCHLENIEEFFKVEENFLNKSSHFKRRLFLKAEGRGMFKNVVPIVSFKSFLKRVDFEASKIKKIGFSERHLKDCFLKVGNSQMDSNIGVFYNSQFLGTLDESGHGYFKLRCPKEKKGKLVLRDINIDLISYELTTPVNVESNFFRPKSKTVVKRFRSEDFSRVIIKN